MPWSTHCQPNTSNGDFGVQIHIYTHRQALRDDLVINVCEVNYHPCAHSKEVLQHLANYIELHEASDKHRGVRTCTWIVYNYMLTSLIHVQELFTSPFWTRVLTVKWKRPDMGGRMKWSPAASIGLTSYCEGQRQAPDWPATVHWVGHTCLVWSTA